ncbi:hypothetical protein K388_07104 [Streptomyces sp. KhCrAH-43]|uniref:hypothetical protein n=1 Tax=unclassified Streptomyces TaxID=2593676 RepID=UPI000DC42DDF|nr:MULTISPECIES: hypothetical protein [unclassified Streptomyces]MYS32908.1 hypothetical protein [Streptomyces sp. SID4920]MYX64301.1 hypothetical protein [Streptomyces sp. SID8373]RAJ47867.1 hypothetical protein K388_07104 [Streptomyces sp. KhCrAH-43]
MSVLPVDDVAGQTRRSADPLVGDRSAVRPARTTTGSADGLMGGATCGVHNEHQQLDAAQGVYGATGRSGQQLNAVGALGLVGLPGELLDFGGKHVDVILCQRGTPSCWL